MDFTIPQWLRAAPKGGLAQSAWLTGAEQFLPLAVTARVLARTVLVLARGGGN